MPTVATDPAYEEDATYFWPSNVTFVVERCKFRVPRYPFLVGSEYFSNQYNLKGCGDGEDPDDPIHLEGVTLTQFRVFLAFMFPLHTTSIDPILSKEEWLAVLKLATVWHFHSYRKLAIAQLDQGGLTPIELIRAGRMAYVPRWVHAGYSAIVRDPNNITGEGDGEVIGAREVAKLWMISRDIQKEETVEDEVGAVFSCEMTMLEGKEREHRTKEDVEEHGRLEEGRKARDDEKRLLEETEEKQRVAEDEQKGREEEERRKAAEIEKQQREKEDFAKFEEAMRVQAEQARLAAKDAEITRLQIELNSKAQEEARLKKEIEDMEKDAVPCRPVQVNTRSVFDPGPPTTCKDRWKARRKLEERRKQEAEEAERSAQQQEQARKLEEEAQKRVEEAKRREKEEQEQMKRELDELRAWKAEHEHS